MNLPKIGIVGLGSIAQKAYLPILTSEKSWTLIGAYSPTKSSRNKICKQYGMQAFDSLLSLAENIDAAFVHSSTESHYEVVSQLLKKGIDVYVDKPLAATLEEAEKLVTLSQTTGRKLMVGFNRRFVPMYIRAKELALKPAWIKIEKHRTNKVRQESFELTLLDDYIHLVDLVRWFGGQEPVDFEGIILENGNHNLIYSHHRFKTRDDLYICTGMHRKAGTNLEKIELVSDDRIIRVMNLDQMEIEENNTVIHSHMSSWDSIQRRRGFEGAVDHFVQSIIGDTNPVVNCEEAYKSQHLLHKLIKQHVKKN